MIVLGLSFDFHDAAAALMVDGKVVTAAQEERFTRIKHDASFPKHAIRFCLRAASIDTKQIDAIAYYEDPLVKFDRILWAAEREPERMARDLESITANWFHHGKFEVRERIAKALSIDVRRVTCVGHHDSHMAAAFYCSPFPRATIVTMDAVGEFETAAWGFGDGISITKLGTVSLPHSLGLFYSAFTSYLGFEVNEGEYKVMGMAAYGEPRLRDELLTLFRLKDDGSFELDQRHFNFATMVGRLYRPSLIEWLGPPRESDEPFIYSSRKERVDGEVERRSRHFADIAASVQAVTEELILHVVRSAVAQTGINDVCLAGGVALNGLANGRLMRNLGTRLYVQPAAGDAGSAIGAAAALHHRQPGARRMSPLTRVDLGPSYVDKGIDSAIRRSRLDKGVEIVSDHEVAARAADVLADNKVIGWYHGRAEWGPRALGNRSILASPLHESMRDTVNERIKFREQFRPFAPIVPLELVEEYFECPMPIHEGSPERFMLAVHRVRPQKRAQIPAVVHADGTARVQAVDVVTSPLLHRVLIEFGRRTGTPVLLNTSFNLRGEPIVNDPDDALRTFIFSNLDLLIMRNRFVRKEFAL